MSTRLAERVYYWIKNSQYWLLPGTCVVCRRASGRPLDLCETCEQSLPLIRRPCPRCGLPLPAGTRRRPCGFCLLRPPPFHCCVAPLRYAPPVDGLISGFKYHARLPAGKVLAGSLAAALVRFYRGRPLPQLLIPVPLHPRRLRSRGYNQALELAREIAPALGLPLDPGCCRRHLETPPQKGLDARQRRRNLRGAFSLEDGAALAGLRRVALLDDVITTGSTAGEITRLLLRAGVAEVHVWALARATAGNKGDGGIKI